MTGGHSNNDQIDYKQHMTVVVIVIMTGGHSNNNQIDYIKQITYKVIVTMTDGHSNNDHKSKYKSAIKPGPFNNDHELLL